MQHQRAEALFVSVLTVGEIRQGIEQLRRNDAAKAEKLGEWLTGLSRAYADRVLPVDMAVAEEWGRLRATASRTVPVIDALLAATAKVHGLTLVTQNDRDFRGLGVPVLNPLKPIGDESGSRD